ncbi:MAG: mechanosensitive ion channel [Gammaproteobacteria bacterium]|nr:mechanosensitive ion channel [Gammaproteobacteria bacterium]MDH3464482.1 mechanosensitive ion channel [Gammaproteobacteria bacterium]
MLRRWCWMALAVLLTVSAAIVQGQDVDGVEPSRSLSEILLDEADRYTAEFDKLVEQELWDEQLGEWEARLREITLYVDGSVHDRERTAHYAAQLKGLRGLATATRNELREKPKSVQRLLDALGVAPDENQPPEAAEIASRRVEFTNDIAMFRARSAEIDVHLARISELEAAVSSLRRVWLLDRLAKHYALPVSPKVLAAAATETSRIANAIIHSPLEWHAGLSRERQQTLSSYSAFGVLILALLLGWGLRRQLLRYCGRDGSVAEPGYSRRFLAAVTEGVSGGLIPALIVAGVLFFAIHNDVLTDDLFSRVAIITLTVLLFFLLVAALPNAVLAPTEPAWRLIEFSADSARLLSQRVLFLAAVVAIDVFVVLIGREFSPSDETFSIYGFVFITLEAMAVISLTARAVWQPKVDASQQVKIDETNSTAAGASVTLWSYVRRLVAIVALLGGAAAIAGYTALGVYLVRNILITGGAIMLALLVRGVFYELVSVLVRWPVLRRRYGLRPITLKRMKIVFSAAVDPVLSVLAGFVILAGWGVPPSDLWRWVREALRGFTVGNITISVVDIVLAIAVFFVAMLLTRLLQRLMLKRVLPQTRLDMGARYALSAGLGYVGVILAFGLAIVALGISFTNVALVAGALSVGIGFGLQTIVNNFVSGFILLVERPVKVGDWVVVGAQEGFVKRINFRATEIETFQRASVIVPNAEILSNAVTNLTYKDRYGRVDIAVGVAYGTNPKLVEAVLLGCASAHQEVLEIPAPDVVFSDFGASSLDFTLRCYTGNVLNRPIIASDLRFDIEKRFREENIEIPFPQRVVHLANSETAPSLAD